MLKTIMDVVAVWTVTILANVGADFLDESLPHIRDGVTILSCIFAISFTIYRFYKASKEKKSNGNKR